MTMVMQYEIEQYNEYIKETYEHKMNEIGLIFACDEKIPDPDPQPAGY